MHERGGDVCRPCYGGFPVIGRRTANWRPGESGLSGGIEHSVASTYMILVRESKKNTLILHCSHLQNPTLARRTVT